MPMNWWIVKSMVYLCNGTMYDNKKTYHWCILNTGIIIYSERGQWQDHCRVLFLWNVQISKYVKKQSLLGAKDWGGVWGEDKKEE